MKNWVLGAGDWVLGTGRRGPGVGGWVSAARAWVVTAVGAAFLAGAAACTTEGAATRAREAQEKIQAQLADPSAAAQAQKVSPEVVKEVQQNLSTLREYLGEVNGELDSVTVNAIQAFQSSAGLTADGMLDDRTVARLREAAAQKKTGKS